MKNNLIMALPLAFIAVIWVTSVAAKERPNESSNNLASLLQQKKWIHGSANCKSNTDPAIEVYKYDQSSYVLRQNKCATYEAPFIYVLFGNEKVLVLDTGATESVEDFPLYSLVKILIEEHSLQGEKSDKEILVIHSHSHRDHYAGDVQFIGQPNVTVVAPNSSGINQYFAFAKWPDGLDYVELGGRKITVIPTPGHQEEAISIYDPQNKWLLTGDTFYPGTIYVKNWSEYKKSISRLVSFSNSHEVSLILGAHIEMTNRAGEYYSIGTNYQPDEASLTLLPIDLAILDSELQKTDKENKVMLNKLIVLPMSTIQKIFSNVARWIIQ
ncbi:MAG: MBL fold metallo-hydrolase [Paraglaciecola polaris]|uniref:MBL fold metallo-hydrolase n=1 Tax=Paraglaciecola polaris TaxID=222814 RepID=UPI003001BFB6